VLGTARPRDLHPIAWWIWALGASAAASFTTNPLLLGLVVAAVCVVVAARRSGHRWARAFRLYLVLGAVIVVVRVIFRIVFGGVETGTVLVDLPTIDLPAWAAGIQLLGPITVEGLTAGLYDGMRLATIVICVGAANSLANPKRTLACVPPALYEIGTALVVAVSIFPQLVDSARRVRAAHALRGAPGGRLVGLRRFVVPVLEDSLERSLSLAASMDTRGYGRSGGASRTQRWVTGSLLVAALLGICLATYAVLDPSAATWPAGPVLVASLLLAAVGIVVAGRRVQRTRYRPDPWLVPETLTAAVGVAVAVAVHRIGVTDIAVAFPDLGRMPYLSLPALLAGAAVALPAVLTPPPRSAGATTAPQGNRATGRRPSPTEEVAA
jgi:energy-coupling factor transport system permease protein